MICDIKIAYVLILLGLLIDSMMSEFPCLLYDSLWQILVWERGNLPKSYGYIKHTFTAFRKLCRKLKSICFRLKHNSNEKIDQIDQSNGDNFSRSTVSRFHDLSQGSIF